MTTKLLIIALFVAAAAATIDHCNLYLEAATTIQNSNFNVEKVLGHDAVKAAYVLLEHQIPGVFETKVSEHGFVLLPKGINNAQSTFLYAHIVSNFDCSDNEMACEHLRSGFENVRALAKKSIYSHGRKPYSADMIEFLNSVGDIAVDTPITIRVVHDYVVEDLQPTGVDILMLDAPVNDDADLYEVEPDLSVEVTECTHCMVPWKPKKTKPVRNSFRANDSYEMPPRTTEGPANIAKEKSRNLWFTGNIAQAIVDFYEAFSVASFVNYAIFNGAAYMTMPTDDLGQPILYYRLSGPVHILWLVSTLTTFSLVRTVYLAVLFLFCVITSYVAVANFILFIHEGAVGIYQTAQRYGNAAKEMHRWIYSIFVQTWFIPAARDTGARVVFNDCEDIKQRPAENHTHPVSAADRNSASLFADHLAAKLGRTAYYVQCAKADLRRNRAGCRTWYWSKDMTISELPFNPPPDALLVLIDVDQYMDMNSFLAANEHPVLIYTFQPTAVAAVRKDYMYTFTDNIVDYRVTGGGVYTHPVWNWSKEEITATTSFFTVPYRSTSYLVDRRFSDEDHELIMLTPIGTWYGFPPSRKTLKTTPMGRLEIRQNNGYNRMVLHHRGQPKISTGREGLYTSAVVDVKVDNAIAIQMMDGGHALSLGVIKEMLPGRQDEAVALYGYYKTIGVPSADVVISPSEAVIRYQFKPREYQGDAKPSLIAFMSPLLHGAYAPDKTRANEKVCIEERISKVKPKEIVINAFLSTVVNEFINEFIPADEAHKLIPSELSEVWDNMIRPTQRQGLLRAVWKTVIKPETETFMKAEAYGNVKPPRNISTVDGKLKYEYSQVIYSVTKYLKRQPWYAFGKTPRNIAARVTKVCEGAQHVISSDFSKFDGRVSNLLRHLEEAVLMRLFRFEHHEQIRRLHKAQYQIKGRAKFGTKYDTGFSRLSGSPETACFNSIDNAFVAFFAWRLSKTPAGSDVSPREAYQRLGIYGGDDGLTADLPLHEYKSAAAQVGQETTTEVIPRGSLGVKFLARMYTNTVWHGDADSICDLKRTLAKFHTTPHLQTGNYSNVSKLVEKLRSLEYTDANTPIFRELIRTAHLLLYPAQFPDNPCPGLTSWDVLQRHPADEYYPNAAGPWMMDYLNKELPCFDNKKFTRALNDCKNLTDMLELPLCARTVEPASKTDVIVNGDLYGPSAAFKEPTKPRQPPALLTVFPERKHPMAQDKYEAYANFLEMSDAFGDDGNRDVSLDFSPFLSENLESKEQAYANTEDDFYLRCQYSEYYDEAPPKGRKHVPMVWRPVK